MGKEMKQHRYATLPEKLPICIQRELNEGFRVAITVILSISMAFVVIILGTFINNRVKNLVIAEDFPLSAVNSIHPVTYFTYKIHPLKYFPQSSSSNNTPPNISSKKNAGELGHLVASKKTWPSMSDEELIRQASMVPNVHDFPINRMRKVAFMFLTRGKLPLSPLWELFFKGHEGFYSIYIHTSPEYMDETAQFSVFYKRRIPSKVVAWGKPSMIDAERRLLANALLESSNERFVLLSETCIPLFNFTTIYNYLINSNLSFLGLFDDPRKMGRGRYNKRMYPTISLSEWRKGSQWFEVHRDLALKIISDKKYYSVFEMNCRPPCYMDEHYLPTLVNKIGPNMSVNRSVTWADWSAGGSHPTRFMRKDVNADFINRIKYESNCTYSSNTGEMLTSFCFLFARKFHPGTLQPLLQIARNVLGL